MLYVVFVGAVGIVVTVLAVIADVAFLLNCFSSLFWRLAIVVVLLVALSRLSGRSTRELSRVPKFADRLVTWLSS